MIDAKTNSKENKQRLLYKYLDINGAKAMLLNSNLQFTNATKFNDPFDCHPALIDFSKITTEQAYPWGKENTISLKINPYERNRDEAWICCLSKVFDSILMWSYYNKHEGVCIGVDVQNIELYINYMLGTMVFPPYEVEYKDIIEKPDFFAGKKDFFLYQILTKGKEWAHEQEVRMFIFDPNMMCMDMHLPYEPKDENEVIDWKEVRAYPTIGTECFAALYLGVNISREDREEITLLDRKLNSDIRVYQMSINPNVLKLDFELI